MFKTFKVKFLGTSSGMPMPREGCQCAQCHSRDPKDQRLRPSLLIEKQILIDAGPDILKQLTSRQIENLDTVILTHEHNDHTGGLKYLLKLSRDLRIIRMTPGQHFKLLGVDFFGFRVEHSKMAPTTGLEIGEKILYVPDSLSLDIVRKYLEEVQIAILDGSIFERTALGHMAMKEIIALTKPFTNLKKIYFTHNGHTNKTHREMVSLVQSVGDKRYTLATDGLELEI